METLGCDARLAAVTSFASWPSKEISELTSRSHRNESFRHARMIVLPVVGRELCAESRRPFNYWLRMAGAGVLTLVAALFVVVLLTVLRGNLVRVLTAARPAPVVVGATLGPVASGAVAFSSVLKVDEWGGLGFLSHFRHLLAFATNLPWDEPVFLRCE